MSTITKERLEPVIERLEHYATNVKWTNVQAAQDMLIAVDAMRIALASLEAEAAITVGDDGGDALAYRRLIQTFAPGTKLYTAPPAPVSVPEPIKRNDADGWWMYKGRRVGGGCAEWYNRALDDCRAAMLQGADGNSPVIPDCSCHTCRPVTFADSRFVVCPECGNKRCPHANDHRNACSGSNEPGQEGSAYPAAPQQEVKP